MKKLLAILGGLFGLLLLAAIIVPFVVDVDKYRPTIVSKANEKLNGKLELGKLGLSLWGRVHIAVDGLKLTDSGGVTVIEVKDASFNLPFASLLTGRPEVRIELDQPLVNVVKQKNGKLNVMTLMKDQPKGEASPQAGAPGASAPADTAKKGEGTEVPALVMNSRLTFLLERAKVAYKDAITGDAYNVNDLNFRLEDVSPSSDMPFEISANLDLTMQQKIKVSGPVVLDGNVKASSSGGEFEKADAKASLKLDGAEITYPGTFEKKKGVRLGADLVASVLKDSFNASTIKFRLADVEIDGQASGKTAGETTTIDFKAHSNKIDIAKFGDLSPLVKEYNLNGQLELAVQAHGPTSRLAYGADLKLNKVALNHESLKQALELNGALAMSTNNVENLSIKLTAPKDFDVNVSGSLQNLAAPRFKLKLVSNNMDLDGLLKSSEKAAQARKDQAAKAEGQADTPADAGKPADKAPVVDYNAMFEPLRKSPMVAASAGTFNFNLRRIKSTGIVIDNMQGQLALNNLVLALKDFSMKIFDGSIKGAMSFNIKPAKPEVATNLTMSGLQTQKMVESSMPIARNTIKGAISANVNIGGPGLNQPDIINNWKGNGTMDVKNAVFSTIDVGRQIREGAINKLPENLRGKIKVPDGLLDRQGEYETVNMKFALANGTFNVNEVNGKAHPNKGLDLKGSGKVQLSNYGLDMGIDLIDTYNMLNAEETLGRDSRYNKFTLPARVGGTLFSPKFDFGASLGKLAENAFKQQAKERVGKAIGDKIPGAGNVLDKVFGGGNKGGDQPQQPQQEAPKPAEAVGKALKGIFGR